MLDPGGAIREASWDYFLDQDMYAAAFFWEGLYRDSLRKGTFLVGRLAVFDLSGMSFARTLRGRFIFGKHKGFFPGGEHPMPEGFYKMYIINVPTFFFYFWKARVAYAASKVQRRKCLCGVSFSDNRCNSLCVNLQMIKPLFPRRTQGKFRVYKRGDDARLRRDLEKDVAPEQLPQFLGGTNPERWLYGDGGDVPKGFVKAQLDEIAAAEKTRGKEGGAGGEDDS